eukprot:6177094-Pleurochrysis_carterae.AAC.1
MSLSQASRDHSIYMCVRQYALLQSPAADSSVRVDPHQSLAEHGVGCFIAGRASSHGNLI